MSNFISYVVTSIFIVLAPMITHMLIWFSFERDKWCDANFNHIQKQDKTPVGHLKKTSNPWRDTKVKQGYHVV